VTILRLSLQSLANRWMTALLAVASIALSVMLLLGVEKVRTGARQSFADTISGTDLIVGARTGGIQLLLYSIFRIGNATNNITWASYQEIARQPEVAWTVPLSLGDSHRGFRVLGTSRAYFEHYRYRRTNALTFAAGKPFSDLFDAVIGSQVAKALGYKVGDKVVIAHGLGSVSFVAHDDKPFRIAGVLAPTGTPVDRTVHVSLAAIEAIHVDWQSGSRQPGPGSTVSEVRKLDLEPKAITAALIGLKSRLMAFRLQRAINDYPREALTAVLPGVALQELWGLVGVAETALSAISWMVVATALLGLATMILTTLNERRREMAILRAVGAPPRTVLALLSVEAGLVTLTGVLAGLALTYLGLVAFRPLIDREYGLYIAIDPPTWGEMTMLCTIVLAGVLAGFIPAIRAYRLSLADGMTVRT
jgi:putative ABC transport system permease protein